MTDEEKRQLARSLLPHLAWDLMRADVRHFNPDPNTTGTAGRVFMEEIANKLAALMAAGEGFTVAIIPHQK